MREASYEELRPHTQVDTLVFQNGQQVAQQPKYIMLRDGRRIYHAEDLGTVVQPHSPTAQAAQRSKQARERIRNWQIAGYTIAGLGMATAAVGAATTPDAGSDGFSTHLGISAAGVVVGAIGVFVAVYGAMSNAREFGDERATAFALYDQDLRKALELCVAGTAIVACEPASGAARTPGSPFSAPPVPFPAAPAPGAAAAPPAPGPDAPAPGANAPDPR